MKPHSLTGIARLRAAWTNSCRGFRDIWRMEEAFRIEAIVTLAAIPVAFLIASSAFQAAALISSLIFLLIVEVLNSAIEAVVDRIGEERHELSRIAKDLGSLAVLLATLVPVIFWAAVVAQRLFGFG